MFFTDGILIDNLNENDVFLFAGKYKSLIKYKTKL